MSSPSDALPPELDFAKNPEASPDRMNRAMTYIVFLIRAATAQSIGYEAAIEELRTVGFERLAIALTPLFDLAREQSAEISAVHAQWVASGALAAIKADIAAMFGARVDAVEQKTVAAGAAIAANSDAIAANAARLEADRWFLSHG